MKKYSFKALIVTTLSALICVIVISLFRSCSKEEEDIIVEPSWGPPYSQTSGDVTVSGKAYASKISDVNAVIVSGGTFTMTNCAIKKSDGDTGNPDNSSFYGTNSAVLSSGSGSKVNIDGGTIATDAIGANGIVAYGGTVNVINTYITCDKSLSRGILATGGGTITASRLNIRTTGSNSSVIALERGGGTVMVNGGYYNASGKDCAILYSTGNLTVNNIAGSSWQGEMGVVEGNNSITINYSGLTARDRAERGFLILQSGSGDAGTDTNGIINVKGGSLSMIGTSAPLIEIVTNVKGQVTLDAVKTTVPSYTLMKVDYNKRWTTNGATGVLILSGKGTEYMGRVVADSYSSIQMTVNQGVKWYGSINGNNEAKSANLTIDGGTWFIEEDSNIDTLTLINDAVIHNFWECKLNYKTLINTSGKID